MSNPYNAADWYWLIANRVYSSARNAYVDITDAAYVAWKDGNGAPPVATSEAEVWPSVSRFLPAWLFDGETFIQPTATTYSRAQLKAYSAALRYEKETGGMTVGGVTVSTDRESQAMINGAYNMAVRNGSFTTKWKTDGGSFAPLDAPTIIAFATAIGQHVADCFAAEASVASQIDAGTLISLPEINAAFASVA